MEEEYLYTSLRSKELREKDPNPSWLSPLARKLEKADERKELFHYTNIESLLKISSSLSLKFSRIDRLNDPLEKNPLSTIEFYKRIFVASFTYEKEESIPMWKMYTQKGMGVRIDFTFKKDSIGRNFADKNRNYKYVFPNGEHEEGLIGSPQIGKAEIIIKDIVYDKNAYELDEAFLNRDNGISIIIDHCGMFKSTKWEYEKETRLALSLSNEIASKYDINFILVPISADNIDSLKIRFDPWMSEELKMCIKLGVSEYLQKWGVKYSFDNSELSGMIR